MSETSDKAAAACVALLGAMTRRRDGAEAESDLTMRAYIVRLREYSFEVLRVLPNRWTHTEAGQWWPTVREITQLADTIEAEIAGRDATRNVVRIGEAHRGGGVTLQPTGATAQYVAAAKARHGADWAASWLGVPDPTGGAIAAPWVRYTPTEVHTLEVGVQRLRERTQDLLDRFGVKLVASQAANDMAIEWARSLVARQDDAKMRRRAK